jgi:hypothetical protein
MKVILTQSTGLRDASLACHSCDTHYALSAAPPLWRRTGGMAQAIEHLFCKYGALSSNPSATKTKKKTDEHSYGGHSFWSIGVGVGQPFSPVQYAPKQLDQDGFKCHYPKPLTSGKEGLLPCLPGCFKMRNSHLKVLWAQKLASVRALVTVNSVCPCLNPTVDTFSPQPPFRSVDINRFEEGGVWPNSKYLCK